MSKRWPRAAALLLIAAGVSVSVWSARVIDHRMRESLLQQARLVMRSVNVARVRALSGSPADLPSSDYLRLKQQLASAREANPRCQFLYLTGINEEGAVFFLVDSEPPDSDDYSPPGQVYDEASPEFLAVFREKSESVEGPASDRWGTWVSALVPLTDPETGELLAVLGMDIDAGDWNYDVASRAAVPSVLAALALLFAFFFAKARRAQALLRRQGETLRENERELQWLFRSMINAFGVFESVFDEDGELVDFRFVYLNDAFERVAGVRDDDVRGETTFEVWPETEPEWIERFGEVAITGHSQIFDLFHAPTGKTYHCNVYRPWDTTRRVCVISEDVTERIRTEELNRRNLLAIGQAEEIARLGYFERNWRTGEGYWSDGFCRLLGIDPHDVRSHAEFLSFIHADDLQRVVDHIRQSLADRTPMNVEFRIVRTDGAVIRILGVGTNVYEDGTPLLTRGTFQDVTESREASRALATSEAKYRLVAENTVDVIWMMGPDMTFTYVNPSIFPTTGFTPEEWIGTRLSDHCDEENFAKMAAVIAERMTGDPDAPGASVEAELLRKDGSSFPVEIRGKVFFDDSGTPVRIQGVTRDVTERKESEKALREREELYRVLIENAEVLVSLFDRSGTCLMLNEKAARSLGGQPAEFVGKTFHELHPIESGDFLRRIREVIDTQQPAYYEDVVPFPNGERHLLSNVQPVRNAAGDAYAVQVISQDVTEMRMLEDQLRQSQKMEAIGRLAGGIAHDFNNLLTVISNYSALMLTTVPVTDPMHDDIEEIQLAADRAADLTRQLLAFGRKQIIAPEVIDVNDSVAQAEKMLRRIIGEDIELRFIPTPDLRLTRFDPGQIEQILFNLAVNARDAMPDGGKLTLETRNVRLDEEYRRGHAETGPGEYVLLAISDTGHGMDADTKANVFEPFFTTKEKGKGTGLGLSTVYGIVKQHGGSIEVYSEVGEGTTFTIYMPVVDGKTARKTPQGEEGAPGGRETILLVEDEAAVRRIARRILEQLGYRVVESGSADEAVRECQKPYLAIDMVLSDVVMPDCSGKVCYERLAVIRPGLRVLYMSGYTENAIAHRGVLDEGTYFVQKPFTVEELAWKVREVLDSDAE